MNCMSKTKDSLSVVGIGAIDVIILKTSYLSHPDILIRKPIRSSKNLRINLKFWSWGILGNLYFDPDKNYAKKSYQEMIRGLQLLIRMEISLIRKKNIGLPDDWGRTSKIRVMYHFVVNPCQHLSEAQNGCRLFHTDRKFISGKILYDIYLLNNTPTVMQIYFLRMVVTFLNPTRPKNLAF